MVARGEVWWYEHQDHKRRPHVILSRPEAVAILPRLVSAPATRRARGIPSEVPLDRDDGMPEECVVSLDNIEVIDKSLLVERICSLSDAKMEAICSAMRFVVDC